MIERETLIKEFLKPVLGKDLKSGFPFLAQLLFPEIVANGPAEAVKKIESYYDEPIAVSGRNISGIEELRSLLLLNAVAPAYVNGWMILAPHTHWSEANPIIYRREKDVKKYWIGPHDINSDETYFPVSFAIHNFRVIPYEWADSSVLIDINEFELEMNLLNKLKAYFNLKPGLFGMGLDFRFKPSLFQQPSHSVEIPDINSKDAEAFSFVIPADVYFTQSHKEDVGQVAWHPYATNFFKFNTEENLVLKELQSELEKFGSEEEKRLFLQEISKLLDN